MTALRFPPTADPPPRLRPIGTDADLYRLVTAAIAVCRAYDDGRASTNFDILISELKDAASAATGA